MYAIAEVAGTSRQHVAALSAVIPQLKLRIALVTLAQQRGASDGRRPVPQAGPWGLAYGISEVPTYLSL